MQYIFRFLIILFISMKMKNAIKWKLVKFFTSLQNSIIILLIIAFYAALGTIIEQNKTLEFYQLNYPLSNPLFRIISWRFIQLLELDHVYNSHYFILLIILLVLSLLTCTFSIQLPILKISKSWLFYKYQHQFTKLKNYSSLSSNSLASSLMYLYDFKYSSFQQRNSVYSYKGLVGRFAPIVVHFSIVLILFGSVLSSFFGFTLQEIIPQGEVFHFQNIVRSGQLGFINQDLQLKVNNFWIQYNSDKSINQFFSSIVLQNSKEEVLKSGLIYVNQPLRYKGLSVYQTDWNLIGIRLRINNSTLQLPFKLLILNNGNRIWTTYIPVDQSLQKGYFIIVSSLDGQVSIYSNSKQFLFSINKGQLFYLDNISLEIVDILSSTGLQIKADPGIFYVYSGFLFVIFSTIFSYFSYSQIWLSLYKSIVLIGGNTNRANLIFEEDFWSIENKVQEKII
uniref:Cytochrome c biogenesis protein Ccs1 n=1 Tax=Compsopogon caeruleus TaxID=31354 RepID=A0A1Z1XBC2_9RHOD|nr:c-type cytochrome biogenensis protein [Compsopogon caeruleus]ARX96155.1 c-type cytochrome biogenensis protein [Compsopogon caeruleus]